ncbi:MAG: hypothetical protein RMI01_08585 [Thermodesulfovibrio sp.]|nr:hypothetical protein [Thermodesulfovibrio sp.]
MKLLILSLSNSSSGNGIREAYTVALEEVSGFLDHQICNVDICPCFIFFSLTDSRLTSFTGKISSMNLLV